MADVNKVIVLGRLTKDPEIKKVGEKSVCEFTVAVNEKWKDKNGQPQERAEFFNIVVWGRLGGLCKKCLSKGRQVYLEGSQRTETYEKDGTTQYFTKVVSSNIQFLDDKKSNQTDKSNGNNPPF